jgi:hypothetical protein
VFEDGRNFLLFPDPVGLEISIQTYLGIKPQPVELIGWSKGNTHPAIVKIIKIRMKFPVIIFRLIHFIYVPPQAELP